MIALLHRWFSPHVRTLMLVSYATTVAAAGCGDDGRRPSDAGSPDVRADGPRADAAGDADAAPADGPASPAPLPDASPDLTTPVPSDAAPPVWADAATGADGDAAIDASPGGPDAGSDGPRDDAADGPSLLLDPCEGQVCPASIDPQHLQLWLRGDRGVTCEQAVSVGARPVRGRVRTWSDLSGHQRQAVAVTGRVGPVCDQMASAINGRAALGFAVDSAEDGQEALEVDLGFLVNRPFTVAVVERRREMGKFANFVLGSKREFPDATQCENPNVNAGLALTFGYLTPGLLAGTTWGPDCDALADAKVPTGRPAIDWLIYQPGKGVTVFQSGFESDAVTSDAAPGLTKIGTGLIGRGWEKSVLAGESLFHGDLGEIVIYDAALGDQARASLTAYLQRTWRLGASALP